MAAEETPLPHPPRRRRWPWGVAALFAAPVALYLVLWAGFMLWAWYDPVGHQEHLNRTLRSDGFVR